VPEPQNRRGEEHHEDFWSHARRSRRPTCRERFWMNCHQRDESQRKSLPLRVSSRPLCFIPTVDPASSFRNDSRCPCTKRRKYPIGSHLVDGRCIRVFTTPVLSSPQPTDCQMAAGHSRHLTRIAHFHYCSSIPASRSHLKYRIPSSTLHTTRSNGSLLHHYSSSHTGNTAPLALD
jgi:hypothetical protein